MSNKFDTQRQLLDTHQFLLVFAIIGQLIEKKKNEVLVKTKNLISSWTLNIIKYKLITHDYNPFK